MSHVKHPSHPVDARTSSQIARARAHTCPSGPTTADAVIALRPSRPIRQASSTWSVSSRTGRSWLTVSVPSSHGASDPGAAGWNDGQSSAAHTVSGAASPSVGQRADEDGGRVAGHPGRPAPEALRKGMARARWQGGLRGRGLGAGRRSGDGEVEVGRRRRGEHFLAAEELDGGTVAAHAEFPPEPARAASRPPR